MIAGSIRSYFTSSLYIAKLKFDALKSYFTLKTRLQKYPRCYSTTVERTFKIYTLYWYVQLFSARAEATARIWKPLLTCSRIYKP